MGGSESFINGMRDTSERVAFLSRLYRSPSHYLHTLSNEGVVAWDPASQGYEEALSFQIIQTWFLRVVSTIELLVADMRRAPEASVWRNVKQVIEVIQ